MKLSICIITKDRPELFRLCLESILFQQRLPDEIVIIDSSTARERMPKVPRSIQWVYIRDKLTIPQARDRAVRAAGGDLIMFVDDDCIIPANTTERFLAHFVKNHRVDLVMGDILNSYPFNPYAQVQHYFHTIWIKEHFYGSPPSRRFSGGMVLHFDIVCFRKNIFDGVYFDMKAPSIFNDDDIDIGTQLYRAKRNMLYDDTIVAMYKPRTSFFPLVFRNIYIGFSNHYLSDKKHLNVRATPRDVSMEVKMRLIKQSLSTLPSVLKRCLFILILGIYPAFYKFGWLYYWYWSINPH